MAEPNIRQAYLLGCHLGGDPGSFLHDVGHACEAGVLVAKAGFHPIIPQVADTHRDDPKDVLERSLGQLLNLIPGRDIIVLLPGWERTRSYLLEAILTQWQHLEVIGLTDLMVARLEGITA